MGLSVFLKLAWLKSLSHPENHCEKVRGFSHVFPGATMATRE
jgi:hypothetical protein